MMKTMMTTMKRRRPVRPTAIMAVLGEAVEEAVAEEAAMEEAAMEEAAMEEAALAEAVVQLPRKPTGILTLRTTVSTATTPVKAIPMTE
jgi:hypothetical protein